MQPASCNFPDRNNKPQFSFPFSLPGWNKPHFGWTIGFPLLYKKLEVIGLREAPIQREQLQYFGHCILTGMKKRLQLKNNYTFENRKNVGICTSGFF